MTEEAPLYKFEEEQIVRLKYANHIHVFIVGREFDTKAAHIFYWGRIIVGKKIELTLTKFSEMELESVLTADQEESLRRRFPLYSADFEARKEEVEKILSELAGAASMAWNPRPEGVFNPTEAKEHVDAAVRQLAGLFLPKEVTDPPAVEDRGTVQAKPAPSGEGTAVAPQHISQQEEKRLHKFCKENKISAEAESRVAALFNAAEEKGFDEAEALKTLPASHTGDNPKAFILQNKGILISCDVHAPVFYSPKTGWMGF